MNLNRRKLFFNISLKFFHPSFVLLFVLHDYIIQYFSKEVNCFFNDFNRFVLPGFLESDRSGSRFRRRGQGPIPKSDSAAVKARFRGSYFLAIILDFLIVLLVQGIDERFLQRIPHRLHEFRFLFRGRGA